MTAAAMAACCPLGSGQGHRRFLQASCELPDTCPSMACAAIFVPFMEDCGAILARSSSVPLQQFQAFRASCQNLDAGAAQMLEPVNVQMFRVRVSTDGAAQAARRSRAAEAVQPVAKIRWSRSRRCRLRLRHHQLQAQHPETQERRPASSSTTPSASPRTSRPACRSAARSITATSCWRPSTARTPSSAATWRTGCTPGWARSEAAICLWIWMETAQIEKKALASMTTAITTALTRRQDAAHSRSDRLPSFGPRARMVRTQKVEQLDHQNLPPGGRLAPWRANQ